MTRAGLLTGDIKKFLVSTAVAFVVTGIPAATTSEAPATFWPAIAGCTPQQSRTADDVQDTVLKGKDIACIMGQLLTDDPVELAKICEIADKLEKVVPIIRGLVGVRNGARRAGVTFQLGTTTDAGP